ncbi:MAG TPA: beta-ketoacyl-ACP reductase [Candidatus Nanoarchaeia archaeon]|nr:beta-ketoacyl-ACP reductase [Candidatus Nanoarchaeia archaeon]
MKGKTALITGGSRGIGKAIALRLAKEGCNIILNDRQSNEETIAEIKKLGVQVMSVPADVSKFEDIQKMVEEIKLKFPKVDILVNNAGITQDRTLRKMTPEEWNSVISVNLTSVYNVTHCVLPLIPEGGRIINMASIAGISGNFGQCNYSASKAGIIGFTKALAKEVGKNKITVNAIAPGLIKSPMTDKIPVMMLEQMIELIAMKELGAIEDVANLVAFLASDQARYISAEVIRVDGGMAL